MELNGEEVDAVQPVGGSLVKAKDIINILKDAIGKVAIARAFGLNYADTILPSTH